MREIGKDLLAILKIEPERRYLTFTGTTLNVYCIILIKSKDIYFQREALLPVLSSFGKMMNCYLLLCVVKTKKYALNKKKPTKS